MRQLSAREKVLLCILFVVALVSGYLALFRQPVSQRMAELDGQIVEAEDAVIESQIRLAQMEKMQKELEEMRAAGKTPVGMARYDNLQALMFELNRILAQTGEYSLNFGSVDTSQVIVRRNIMLNFTTGSYAAAEKVLRQLHDSQYRCLLSSLSISDGGEGTVETSVAVTFFEYQEEE